MAFLITAFRGFGAFPLNPSVEIGRRLQARVMQGDDRSWRFETVEVSYEAADDFVAHLTRHPPEFWLMLGVAGKADVPRVERVARNRVGSTPDVRGLVRGPGVIDTGLPSEARGNLFDPGRTAPPGSVDSDDAGDYLCNYLYWLGVTRLPTRCGFLHVVPSEVVATETQVELALRVVTALCRD